MCLGVACHLHFWQNVWGLLCVTAATQGGTDTEQESAHKVDFREENPPAAFAGIHTCNLLVTSPALLPTSYPGSPQHRERRVEG